MTNWSRIPILKKWTGFSFVSLLRIDTSLASLMCDGEASHPPYVNFSDRYSKVRVLYRSLGQMFHTWLLGEVAIISNIDLFI